MTRAHGTFALAFALALGLVGCAAESGSEVEEQGAAMATASPTPLARPLLEGVPSAHPKQTGVDTWDVAAVVKGGRSYLLVTGARPAPRRPMEILVGVGSAGALEGIRLELGDALRLTPEMREAISGDVELVAGRLDALGDATIGFTGLEPLGKSRCQQFSFPGGRYLSAALRTGALVVVGAGAATGCVLIETGVGAFACVGMGAMFVASVADGVAFAKECF